MTSLRKIIPATDPFTGSAAQKAAFPVLTKDPVLLAKRATDWLFEPGQAVGHASGALPADGADLAAGGLVNLAIDSSPAIPVGLRGAVTCEAGINATVLKYATDGTAHGGLQVTPALSFGKLGAIKKAGIANNLVGHPPTEGFLDFMVIAWVRLHSLNYSSALGYGQGGGNLFWGIHANGGAVYESLSNRAFAGVAVDAWTQLAAHYAFNTGTGAILVRTFRDGAEINTGLAATAIATTTATMNGWAFNNGNTGLGGNKASPSIDGLVNRASRHFTGLAGNVLDPAVLVATDWAANRVRIAGI